MCYLVTGQAGGGNHVLIFFSYFRAFLKMPFQREVWSGILQDASRSHPLTFDCEKYLLEIDAAATSPTLSMFRQLNDPILASMSVTRADMISQLQKVLPAAPVGQLLSIWIYMCRWAEREPSCSSEVRAFPSSPCDNTNDIVPPSTSDSPSSSHTPPMSVRSEKPLGRSDCEKCCLCLESTAADSKLQLFRGGHKVHKTVFIAPEVKCSGEELRYRFMWIDVTGSCSNEVPMANKKPTKNERWQDDVEYERGIVPSTDLTAKIKEVLSQPLSGARHRSFQWEDDPLRVVTDEQKPLLQAQKSLGQPAFQGSKTLQEVLTELEIEHKISLPLCVAVEQAHGVQRTNLDKPNISLSDPISVIRRKIEAGLAMSYINDSMYVKDHQASKAFVATQHIVILTTASSFMVSDSLTSSILPPEGSEQLKNMQKETKALLSLALDIFLASVGGKTALQQFEEKWVLYFDQTRRILVTVRQSDCIPIARMRASFHTYFCHLSFESFIEFVVEASALHFKPFLNDLERIMDECETLMAPSVFESTLKERNAIINRFVVSVQKMMPKKDLRKENMSLAQKASDLLTRAFRSAQRKVARRHKLPKDVTLSLLRLLNLVYRQTSVYERSLTKTRTTLKLLYQILRHSSTAPMVPISRAACRTGGKRRDPSPRTNKIEGLHFNTSLPFHRSDGLTRELLNNCKHLREHSAELMGLSISLHGEFYSLCLHIIALIHLNYNPSCFITAHFGMNYVNPLLKTYNGYYVTLGVLMSLWIASSLFFFNFRK